MKKYLLDLTVKSVERIHERYVLIKLTDDKPLPEMQPGQFVEIRVDGSPTTFLRRPISLNFLDPAQNDLIRRTEIHIPDVSRRTLSQAPR